MNSSDPVQVCDPGIGIGMDVFVLDVNGYDIFKGKIIDNSSNLWSVKYYNTKNIESLISTQRVYAIDNEYYQQMFQVQERGRILVSQLETSSQSEIIEPATSPTFKFEDYAPKKQTTKNILKVKNKTKPTPKQNAPKHNTNQIQPVTQQIQENKLTEKEIHTNIVLKLQDLNKSTKVSSISYTQKSNAAQSTWTLSINFSNEK